MVLSLLLILWLGLASRKIDRERVILETTITAEQIKIRLESCFNSRARLVNTLARYPWRSRDGVVDAWASRASSLFPLYSGVQALNYVDPDGVIRVIYPEQTNRAARNANLRENANPSVVAALAAAQTSGGTTRTNMVELLQSGTGFALYRQIRSADGEVLGFVNGVFRVDALMNSCLADGRLVGHFAFSLSENGEPFHEQNGQESDGAEDYSVNLEIRVIGQPWQFRFAPLESYLKATDSIVDEIGLSLGVLMTVLLAFAMRTVLIKQSLFRDNEEKYRLLVENQTDMVVKVNPDGEFQYISPSYCETFGKTEDELLGHAFMPLVHEQDRELTRRSIERLKSPPHTSYHEQRAMTKEGWRWLAWSNRAILDNDGKIEAITAVGRDVTQVKRLEQSMAHSQKMRAMGELAGGITHDFNNLLQVIIGTIGYVLMDEKHDQATRDSLLQIRNIAGRAVNLTEKLATLSRQNITRPEVFDINELVRELRDLLVHTLPASVDLSLSLAESELPVLADKSQLEQVLLNICFNARDAVGSKGQVRISTRRHTLETDAVDSHPGLESGEYIVITVEDDGHGIEPHILPRIFDPFFTTKGTDTGLGLGLANCYSIVEQHKGMITVDSTLNVGSSFSVYLPLTASTNETKPASASSERPGADDAGKMALVADDNPQILALTCRVLEQAGFETCAAENGTRALELFETHQDKIRLLVLDLVMPQMGGQEVAEKVRAMSADVAILMVSGFVPEDIKETLAEPIIKKPYTIEAFMEAVDKLL